MDELLHSIRNCKECAPFLKQGCRPVLSASKKAKIVIIGQAPGSVVHRTGIPWDDKSGENLRAWMGIDTDLFYDEDFISIIPMGFCYPGKGKSGDLPPRKECAPLWHTKILTELENVELVLLVGSYAQKYYLKEIAKRTLTETVASYLEYLPQFFVLPHPSPRNNIWMKKNSWFKDEILPVLKTKIEELL